MVGTTSKIAMFANVLINSYVYARPTDPILGLIKLKKIMKINEIYRFIEIIEKKVANRLCIKDGRK